MNRVKFLMVIGVSSETTTNTSLMDWVIGRYAIPIFLIVLCLFWAFYGSEDISYEPPQVNINILDSSKWKFAEIDYATSSLREDLWNLGISRTLDQLDSIRKPVSSLWESLDSLLDQWEQDLNDSD